MSRQELEAKQAAEARRAASNTSGNGAKKAKGQNPMNRLVPYLDLFCRLENEELSRLARVPVNVVVSLRQQVDDISAALDKYADLLPRLRDEELMRLTGASAKTIQFWRLCQPRTEPTVKPAASKPAAVADEPSTEDAAAPDPSDSVVGAVEDLKPDESSPGFHEASASGLHEISGEPFPGHTPGVAGANDADDLDAAFDDITKVGDDKLEQTRDDFF